MAVSGSRDALLIATGEYEDTALRKLRSPSWDAAGLAEVLRDPDIGAFDVTQVIDRPQHEVNRLLETFFLDRSRDDVLLLHVSCHGIKDADGRLYFAAKDTDKKLLDSSAISAAFVHDQLRRCRARSIVVLLDCCYSGAFLPGIKGDTAVHVREELAGHGRVVITATSRTEYAWEGRHLAQMTPEPSRFTGAVIEGLRTGAADRDQDGMIDVHELYEYVYERTRASGVSQRPQMWAALEHRIIIARSPREGVKRTAEPVTTTDTFLLASPARSRFGTVREPTAPQPPAGDRQGVPYSSEGRNTGDADAVADPEATDVPLGAPTITIPADSSAAGVSQSPPLDQRASPAVDATDSQVFKGYTASVTLHADRAEINRRLMGKVIGAKDCVISFADVIKIRCKEPSLFVNGYIQLATAQDLDQFSGDPRHTSSLVSNSRTVVFTWSQRATYAAYLAAVAARIQRQSGSAR